MATRYQGSFWLGESLKLYSCTCFQAGHLEKLDNYADFKWLATALISFETTL